MKVLVTGGRGFIGRWTVKELEARGFEPIVFDRIAETVFPAFLGDIRDAEAVSEAMAHAQAWIHVAGVLGTQETILNPLPAAETNIIGGLNVLQAAAQYKLPGVYIGVGNHWMDNTYSISKTTTERFCNMYRNERGVAISTVRAFNAYGPEQSVASPFGSSKVRKIMPSFVCRALHGQPIEVYGSGQQIMDMIHVKDVAATLVIALEHTIAHGSFPTVIEAGSGIPTTVVDIAQKVIDEVEKQTGVHSEIRFLPMRPGEIPESVVLADLSTKTPVPADYKKIPFEQGLPETVAWYRTHYGPGHLS